MATGSYECLVKYWQQAFFTAAFLLHFFGETPLNLHPIDKKKLFLTACKILFWTICFAFVFIGAIWKLIIMILCLCSGEDVEIDDGTGPHLNHATGEMDAVKYYDGIYDD